LITILFVALVTFMLMISGYWDTVYYFFFGANSNQVWANLVLIIAIVGAIVAVLFGDGMGGGKKA